jgi:DNA-binding TFAR19-related protein (PDSD5 family)
LNNFIFSEILSSVKVLKNIENIEETLFNMISDGDIKAKIDSEKQMIAFIDTASQGTQGEEVRDYEYIEVIEELEN